MTFFEKIKAIRGAEGLTQAQLCEVMDISISTLKKIEAGYHEPAWGTMVKITQHPRFEKYTLWLMTDKTAPEAGQIAPAIAHIGQEKITSTR
ncbi:helix-turn-helix domain-containing protein [Hafnia paralvei]|uniref:helix-turn-helix domain-containing protein n=1 Tax=Hafnia paralvei TaxID=546367 RepID=UPI001033A6DD|nr:helix-turn-helix transcriptional regulator [Hafnia paralvei]TBM28852.1 XRE family transcriptional regulator [Hafnia paralvei]